MAKATKGPRIMKRDFYLFLFSVALFVILLFTMLFGQAMISKTNMDVATLRNQVELQKQTNEVLVMRRDELSSYDKIDAIAKEEGLAYNNSNIRSID